MKMTRSQAGDTIIEVMIALAIIGFTIALAYSITSRSLRIGRQAQERTEAVKLAESQIESLVALARNSALDSTTGSIFHANYAGVESFCVSGGTVVAQKPPIQDFLSNPSAALQASPTGAPTGSQIYHASCLSGPDKRYRISVDRNDNSPASGMSTFNVRVRWERLGGGYDEVYFAYRLHKGQF